MQQPKLLIIQSDSATNVALETTLCHEYDIAVVTTGKTGLYRSDREQYDIIIIDSALSDVPGEAICQLFRERDVATPLLYLSREADIMTKIRILDLGANDFMAKPFSLGEFKARIRALLRHTGTATTVPKKLIYGDLELDTGRHEVWRAGQQIILRRKEFLLLECLIYNQGRAIKRSELIKHAWHSDTKPWTNTLDVHIKHLRDKIDKPFGTPLIQTVHGFGYCLARTPTEQLTAVN